MASPDPRSRDRDLALRLQDGCQEVAQAPLEGARDLPVVSGLTAKCLFTQPLENVRARVTRLLAQCLRVFVLGEAVVYESVVGDARRLVTLARLGAVEPGAAAILANLFICEQADPGREPAQFAPPQQFVALLLNSGPVREALPTIRVYATRPVFDDQFA